MGSILTEEMIENTVILVQTSDLGSILAPIAFQDVEVKLIPFGQGGGLGFWKIG